MNVKKTTGEYEEFDAQKIKNNIIEISISNNEEINQEVINSIVNNLFLYDNIETTEIRRQVENALMSVNKNLARIYIQTFGDRDKNNEKLKKQDNFIKRYIKSSNAATGSKFDSNANVTNKNVVTMGQELYKEYNIKQNRWMLYDKIKSMYSKKLAESYINDLESHVLYKHDETAIPGMPYTYSAKEVIEVKYNGKHLLLPFDSLWNIIEEPEFKVNIEDNVWQKLPIGLTVKDIGNVFTDVTVITKKYRKRDLVRVKTAFGEDIVVTDNHPMIVNIDNVNDTVEAINSVGEKQFKTNNKLTFEGRNAINISDCGFVYSIDSILNNNTVIDFNFGYLVASFIACGNYDEATNNENVLFIHEDKEKLTKINKVFFDKFGYNFIINENKKSKNFYISIDNAFIKWAFCYFFNIRYNKEDRTLPYNVLDYTEEFSKGLICGMVDINGIISDHNITLNTFSRPCMLQITSLLRHFNYSVDNIIQNIPFGNNNNNTTTNDTLWGVNFSYTNENNNQSYSDTLGLIKNQSELLVYKSTGETKITSVTRIDPNDSFLDLNEYIYDITTDTRTFSSNNLLVHNCVSINMYPFLIDGLKKLGGESNPPTDSKSFTGEFINLVYSVSSQFAGAVATPEYLMYFDYYLRKDYGDDYIHKLNNIIDHSTKNRTLEKIIENLFQQVVHSMNMPAGNRGYQCVREDTTQLSTPKGYKYLTELNEGDECYVWKDGKIEIETIKKLNVYNYDGELLQFKGKNYQQTVTDAHRVLYKKANTNKYNIKEAHELFGHSKLSLPIASKGVAVSDFAICDELLKLCVITLIDGTIDLVEDGNINSGRITIVKSKNRWGYKEIPELLDGLGIGYTVNNINCNEFGEMVSIRIPKIDSQIILHQIHHTKKEIPKFFKHLSKRQINIVIDTWAKINGQNSKSSGILLQCDNENIQNDLQEIVFLGGYGSEICKEKRKTLNDNNETFVNYVKVFKRKDKRVSEYNRIKYNGRVWCPTTDAGIVVFREENKIPYFSGNSVFWNVGYFDKPYFEGVFGDFVFPDGTKPNWESLSWLQKKFMKWFNSERQKYVLTFPVETMALLTDDKDIIDSEYGDFASEMWSEGHSFFCYLSDSPDSLASCCRLRNSITKEEHNITTHQFSMGTASVATGSKSVMTINLNRVIQDAINKIENGGILSSKNKDTYLVAIKEDISAIVKRVQKYQTAFNSIIKDFYEENMLDVYSAGFISMNKQYLTIGVNGLTDAAEFLGIETSDNKDYNLFVNTILETINKLNASAKTKELMFNTEFVPGENLSVKNYNWDKNDGYFVSQKHKMYSSYFFNPEDEHLSVIERMKLHGRDYVKHLDGGSACHINLNEHLTKKQYRTLLKIAAMNGTNYFTYNIKNTVCNKCGYISKNTTDKCEKCGSEDVDYLTRIIGYLKRVSSFSEPRQTEENDRYYDNIKSNELND